MVVWWQRGKDEEEEEETPGCDGGLEGVSVELL